LIRRLFLLLAVAALSPAMAHAAAGSGEPIVLGQSYALESATLGGERRINVALPASYASDTDRRYPVLYLLDGGVDQDFVHIVGTSLLGALWGRQAEVIVVGIESVDRRRELTGSADDPELKARYPTAGHAAEFRRFLREEVKPFVAAHYRTSGENGVIGESLAGLFIAETWLREPDLFGSYAAISPSLWWDKAALAEQAPGLIGRAQAGHRLLVVAENEGPDLRAPVDRFVAALGDASGWCYASQQAYGHATVYHATSPMALQFLFPPAEEPGPRLGFAIECAKSN